jgi:putative sporulation protein YyaC
VWNSLIKKNVAKNELQNFDARIHIEHPSAESIFEANLGLFLTHLYNNSAPLIILCIGTDRSTGDSLGPLVGSKLQDLNIQQTEVYGTLDEPVHAVNLQETMDKIYIKHTQPFIVAIDACLGRSESIGFIRIKEGPLQPGTGVNKDLPNVGDIQIVGIVNVGGFMEYMVLQNTRLSLVMKMAGIISRGLKREIEKTIYPLSPNLIYPPVQEPISPM